MSGALKIALVVLHADPSRGGAERYTIDLAAALVKAGHEVSLLATSYEEVAASVNRVALRAKGLTRVGRYRSFLDSLDRHLEQARYDVVHAMLPVRRCDVYHPHAGLAVAAVKEKKLQAMVNPRRGLFASIESDLLGGVNVPVVLALSEYVKRAIEKHYPLLGGRLAILFNAVDIDRFAPIRHPPRVDVVALFVGQDFARKGAAHAISATQKINDARLRLVIVGEKPANYHLPTVNGVTLVGAVDDARPYYHDADFFVLPTKHDPCSLVVLEALAMGLPVISTKFNGATEIMTDGVHGYILDDPTDVDALADRMRKLLDPDMRARMSAACLALRPKLAYEHHLSTLLEIYSTIVSRRT